MGSGKFAVFVDAGYLNARVAQHHADMVKPRLDFESVLKTLRRVGLRHTDGDMLRTYWYDAGERGQMNPIHEALAFKDGVKVKIGHLVDGAQKGVDVMLAVDLIQHAHAKIITDAFIMTNDSDFVYAFDQAQAQGLRIHLLRIVNDETEGSNLSKLSKLSFMADATHDIHIKDFDVLDLAAQHGARRSA